MFYFIVFFLFSFFFGSSTNQNQQNARIAFRRELRDPNEPSALRGRELYHESEALYSKICGDVKRLIALRGEAEELSHVRNPLSETDQKTVFEIEKTPRWLYV